MKKLFLLLSFLIPIIAFGQTSPATLSFRSQTTPTNSKDSVGYSFPGKLGGYSYFGNLEYLRSQFSLKSDGVISGLVTSISGSNANTTAGTYRINGRTFSASATVTALEANDATLYREDILYADTLNTIHKAVGVLGSTYTAPDIPDATIAIANIFISPTGTTPSPPSALVPMYTTKNQTVTGVNNFTKSPVVPQATQPYQATNLAQVTNSLALKQDVLTLTTTGSGPATLTGATLNIPVSSGGGGTAANPTATAGTSAVNGSATTYMRSDAAPKVDSAVFQTVLNFFPKGDTRYLKTTTAASTYVVQTRQIINGLAITGGGTLATDRTLAVDTTIVKSKGGFLIDYNNLSSRINGKQATGNYIIALTGDGTATGPGSVTFTLANTAVTPGAYTNANITVDSKGRVTAASNGSSGGGGSGTVTSITPGYGFTSATPITTSGTLTIDTASTNGIKSKPGFLLDYTNLSNRINTKVTNVATTTGDLFYSSSGSTISRLPIGSGTQVLGIVSGVPAWVTNTSVSAGSTANYVQTGNGSGGFLGGSYFTATSSALYNKANSQTFDSPGALVMIFNSNGSGLGYLGSGSNFSTRFTGATDMYFGNPGGNLEIAGAIHITGTNQFAGSGSFGISNQLIYGTGSNFYNIWTYGTSGVANMGFTNAGNQIGSPSNANDILITGNQSLGISDGTSSQSSIFAYFNRSTKALLVGDQTAGFSTPANVAFGVQSTTRGSNPYPIMTATQRAAISSPSAGLVTYDNTANRPEVYDGTAWRPYAFTSDARSPVNVTANLTMSLNSDYQNITTTQYSLTLPPCTSFATNGSQLITVDAYGSGGIKVLVPSGYALVGNGGATLTDGTGYITLTSHQKAQLIPSTTTANTYEYQMLNGTAGVH